MAHSLKRVGHWNEPRNPLQRPGQYRDRIHDAPQKTGRAHDQPRGGIPALEQQQIAGGNDSQAGKCQNRSDENNYSAQPIGFANGKMEEQAPHAR